MTRTPPVLVIHGGAGTIGRGRMTVEREAAYRAGLAAALRAGWAVLERGGASLDAAIAAVVALEDSPLFNAGRGAVFNAERRHELDAAVIDGATARAGAVACARSTRNPVLAARAVMERTPHVLIAGPAADRLARTAGLPLVAQRYFSTRERAASLARVQAGAGPKAAEPSTAPSSAADRHGTVGAVALDRAGNLAAATSTGGYTNKMAGRVGDSPLPGAGTWADRTCAVSGTGSGEHFIRAVLAYEVSARMRYLGESVAQAARRALARVAALGGEGGLIAVDRGGRIAMPFVSEGMYRGTAIDGRIRVAIYRGRMKAEG